MHSTEDYSARRPRIDSQQWIIWRWLFWEITSPFFLWFIRFKKYLCNLRLTLDYYYTMYNVQSVILFAHIFLKISVSVKASELPLSLNDVRDFHWSGFNELVLKSSSTKCQTKIPEVDAIKHSTSVCLKRQCFKTFFTLWLKYNGDLLLWWLLLLGNIWLFLYFFQNPFGVIAASYPKSILLIVIRNSLSKSDIILSGFYWNKLY